MLLHNNQLLPLMLLLKSDYRAWGLNDTLGCGVSCELC